MSWGAFGPLRACVRHRGRPLEAPLAGTRRRRCDSAPHRCRQTGQEPPDPAFLTKWQNAKISKIVILSRNSLLAKLLLNTCTRMGLRGNAISGGLWKSYSPAFAADTTAEWRRQSAPHTSARDPPAQASLPYPQPRPEWPKSIPGQN